MLLSCICFQRGVGTPRKWTAESYGTLENAQKQKKIFERNSQRDRQRRHREKKAELIRNAELAQQKCEDMQKKV